MIIGTPSRVKTRFPQAAIDTVALDFGWALFGRAGGMLFTLVVGSHASVFSQVRGVHTFGYSPTFRSDASQQNLSSHLPVSFTPLLAPASFLAIGVLDADRSTPIRAVLLQAAISIALILLGHGFRALVRIAVVALWAFYFLTRTRCTARARKYVFGTTVGRMLLATCP